jgi:hypothetical protein
MTVSEAKQRLPLPVLLHREGLGDSAKKWQRTDRTREKGSIGICRFQNSFRLAAMRFRFQ